jgi:hypothetical protein
MDVSGERSGLMRSHWATVVAFGNPGLVFLRVLCVLCASALGVLVLRYTNPRLDNSSFKYA